MNLKLKRLKRPVASVYVVVMRCLGKRVWQRVMLCSCSCSCRKTGISDPSSYHRLKRSLSEPDITDVEAPLQFCPLIGLPQPTPTPTPTATQNLPRVDADDTVFVKITMLGDSHTGKTSLMAKYVTSERNDEYIQTTGVSCMDKVFGIKGVKIAFSIWDFGGHLQFTDVVPRACQDAEAILILFDLTSRSTLNSVTEWYQQARRFNQNAILVLIGTKFDHFIHLPEDIQLTIVTQARIYAHAMGAILFFSSITHNINVHKIFKVVTAKLFDLPCNIARNLTIGEPIIEY